MSTEGSMLNNLSWASVALYCCKVIEDLMSEMKTLRSKTEKNEQAVSDEVIVDRLVEISRLKEEVKHLKKAHEETKEFYAVRIERIKDIAKEAGVWDKISCVLANGTADPTEPHSYSQLINILRSENATLKSSLERLQTQDEEAETPTVDQKNEDDLSGDWICTVSGSVVWPLQPERSKFLISDIAHALSLQCRFAGHTRFHYSVAQHSVLVSQLCPLGFKLKGLLHDASEAYLSDIAAPLKRTKSFEEYRAIEKRLTNEIFRSFGLSPEIPESVYVADKRALATEIRDLMPYANWPILPYPDHRPIRVMSPEGAKVMFLSFFDAYVASGL